MPRLTVKPPTPSTLRRYGLTAAGWLAIWARQGRRCPICGRRPPEVKLVIDHQHCRKKEWRKMTAAQRAATVRGILCNWCNHSYACRGITIERALNIAAYLKAHAERNGEHL